MSYAKLYKDHTLFILIERNSMKPKGINSDITMAFVVLSPSFSNFMKSSLDLSKSGTLIGSRV